MYGGTKTEMERLLKDAEKISGVKYDISNLSDVYGAIHVIQEELGITGTTAKEASTTVTGSMASMSASFKNLLGDLALGKDIYNSFEALTDSVLTFLTGNLIPMVGKIFSQVPNLISNILTAGIRSLRIMENNAGKFVGSGVKFVKDLVVGIISAVPYLVESGIALVSALIESLVNTDWIGVASEMITDLRDYMSLASMEILGSDNTLISAFMQTITDNLPLVLDKGIEIVTGLLNGILSAIPTMLAQLPVIISAFSGFIIENLPVVIDKGKTLLMNLLNGIMSAIPNMLAQLPAIMTAFADYITSVLPIIMEKGVEVLTELVNGIINGIPLMLVQLPVIVQTLLDIINTNLPVIVQKGVDMLVNLVTGIINGIPTMLAKIPQIIKSFTEFMHKNLPTFIKTGFTLIKSLVEGIINTIPVIIENLPKVVKAIMDILKELPKLVISVGKDLVRGLWNGIKSMGGWLMDMVKGWANNILSGIKGFFGIHSPSKVFEQEVGKMLPLGMAVGIEENTKPVDEAMQKLNAQTMGVIDTNLDFTTKSTSNVSGSSEKNLPVIIELLKMLVDKDTTESSNILDRILLILSDYLPMYAERQLVLDTGVLAGELAPMIDEELGTLEYRKGR